MVVRFDVDHIKVYDFEYEQRQKRKQSLHASVNISEIHKHTDACTELVCVVEVQVMLVGVRGRQHARQRIQSTLNSADFVECSCINLSAHHCTHASHNGQRTV